MAARLGRPTALLTLALLVAAGASATYQWALRNDRLPEEINTPHEITLVLLAGALVAVVLHAVIRGAGAALQRRGAAGASLTLTPIETIVAILVALVVGIAVFADRGTALASLGLVGFALTLALQRPILSIAGWAAIRFGRLFREGDRIEVQGIIGDVVEIKLFNTRLWEIGSRDSPLRWGGHVSPLRPSGRIVSLSNATFLEQPVANATADIPYVFDEFVVTVAYEADWRLAERLLHDIAAQVLDLRLHAEAAAHYEALVQNLPIDTEFPREPAVLLSLEQSWIEMRLRYLVDTRRRSRVRNELAVAWQEASARHSDRLPNVYPRSQPMQVGPDGRAKE